MLSQSSAHGRPYFVPLEEENETQRLLEYHRFLTEALGGLFPEQADLSAVEHLLDVGCGPGAWACDVAHAYPQTAITGIDVSETRIASAQALANQRHLDQVRFQVMDARAPLNFPDQTFDLVNARLLQGWMPTQRWHPFLAECLRISRSGGTLRVTECEITITNSPALERLAGMHTRALKRAGYSFSPDGRQVGITAVLPSLLQRAGYQQVAHLSHAIDCSAGTTVHQGFLHLFTRLLPLIQPFLLEEGGGSQEEVASLCEQALVQINSPAFCGIWLYLTVTGKRP